MCFQPAENDRLLHNSDSTEKLQRRPELEQPGRKEARAAEPLSGPVADAPAGAPWAGPAAPEEPPARALPSASAVHSCCNGSLLSVPEPAQSPVEVAANTQHPAADTRSINPDWVVPANCSAAALI